MIRLIDDRELDTPVYGPGSLRSAIAVRTHTRIRRDENAVHTAADRHLPVMQRTVNAAITAARAAVNRPMLREAIKTKNHRMADTAVAAAPGVLQSKLLKTLPPVFGRLILDGRKAGASILATQLRAASLRTADDTDALVKLGFNFDSLDPAAQEWVRDHVKELVDSLTDTTRQELADALINSFEEGDTNQLQQDVIDAVGDETRGVLIARTEVMRAANEGQRQSWDQAIESGLLTGDEKKEWIATEIGACPDCEELDGQQADVDGEYPDPGGEGPPLHPNCRCTEGISADRSNLDTSDTSDSTDSGDEGA